MYAAIWLWGIGQALLLPNWLAGPAALWSFLPMYLLRVPREERLMLDTFGDEYRAYAARTGRVFPKFQWPSSTTKGPGG
jgi:protein-S-isoprenylcysteine O-methyltransferase Ste14